MEIFTKETGVSCTLDSKTSKVEESFLSLAWVWTTVKFETTENVKCVHLLQQLRFVSSVIVLFPVHTLHYLLNVDLNS